MSKNVVEPQRPQLAIWRCVACWVSKATRAQTQASSSARTSQTHASTTPPPPHRHTHTNALTHSQTHTEICKTYCFSTATMVSWTRRHVSLYVHCLSCWSVRIYANAPKKRLLASSCPSVRIKHLGSHWTDFDDIWYLRFFRKYVDTIKVSLKSNNNSEFFTRRCFHIYDNISPDSS